MVNRRSRRKNRSSETGQATTEYILIMTVVVTVFLLLVKALEQSNLQQNLASLITGDFSRAYQNGRTNAVGYDQGEPKNHPRADNGDKSNFRIFFNPGASR